MTENAKVCPTKEEIRIRQTALADWIGGGGERWEVGVRIDGRFFAAFSEGDRPAACRRAASMVGCTFSVHSSPVNGDYLLKSRQG